MSYTTLITATELKQHINNPAFVILDCRAELTDTHAGSQAFAAGHLPGAQHADADTALSDKSPGPNGEFRGRHPLPAQASWHLIPGAGHNVQYDRPQIVAATLREFLAR